MKFKKFVEKQLKNMEPTIELCGPDCMNATCDIKVFFLRRKIFDQNYIYL